MPAFIQLYREVSAITTDKYEKAYGRQPNRELTKNLMMGSRFSCWRIPVARIEKVMVT
jgi:hypothetical protein